MLSSKKFHKRLHATLAIFFALQIPVTPFIFDSPFEVYLAWISQWALVASHWAAYEAAREDREDV